MKHGGHGAWSSTEKPQSFIITLYDKLHCLLFQILLFIIINKNVLHVWEGSDLK